MSYLFIYRSVTYAQRAQSLLKRSGINCYLLKPPSGLTGGTCAYALRIREENAASAFEKLSASSMKPLRTFGESRGVYREVRL